MWVCRCARMVSTHSRPKAAGPRNQPRHPQRPVSTHSRPKAAVCHKLLTKIVKDGFNTQPPEGGWSVGLREREPPAVSTHSRPKAAGQQVVGGQIRCGFNTQPPEGGWGFRTRHPVAQPVSTHSRPKAAGTAPIKPHMLPVFQHTAARRRLSAKCVRPVTMRRFNTQPPEGGWHRQIFAAAFVVVSTHSRPKAAERPPPP